MEKAEELILNISMQESTDDNFAEGNGTEENVCADDKESSNVVEANPYSTAACGGSESLKDITLEGGCMSRTTDEAKEQIISKEDDCDVTTDEAKEQIIYKEDGRDMAVTAREASALLVKNNQIPSGINHRQTNERCSKNSLNCNRLSNEHISLNETDSNQVFDNIISQISLTTALGDGSQTDNLRTISKLENDLDLLDLNSSLLTDGDAAFNAESNKTEVLRNANETLSPPTKASDENELEDELLAELENEFFSMAELQQSSVGQSEYRALKNKSDALQRRLEHTLKQRKELEVENTRLEQKLDTAARNSETVQKQMEFVVTSHQKELDELKEKMQKQEEMSKQTLIDLENEHRLKIEQLTKLHEDCLKEKEGIVVRYAQAEQKNIDLQDKLQKADNRVKEWTKERDGALVKWHTMKADNKKSTELNQTQAAEILYLKKEAEKQKDSASAAEVKVKWHQNKLKAEQDASKELKGKLEEAEGKLKELKNEELLTLDQIRSLFTVLNELNEGGMTLHEVPKKDFQNISDIPPVIRKDLRTLEMKERELVEELRTFRDKVKCLEVERLSQEKSLNTVRDSLQNQRQGNINLQDRVQQLEKTEMILQETEKRLNVTLSRMEELELSNREQVVEINNYEKKEVDQLEFTSRISERNTQLQAENTRLSSEISIVNSQLKERSIHCRELETKNQSLEKELKSLNDKTMQEIEGLRKTLEDERLKLNETMLKLDEAEDEIKTMKRRHTLNIKDLTRELQLAHRRVTEVKENGHQIGRNDRDSTSLGSLGSQGGSCGSLDTVGLNLMSGHEPALVQLVEDPAKQQSKETLLEKISSLEKTIRRKSGKIEFLKDHVDQLIEEVHRKSRIIQGYVLREETGTLVPEASDKNKAQIVKKGGGVMASMYASHALDSSMTIGLSLEINRKLQAILEDTLLKNIKLKEGMDTLGQEIDWLSRENKRLQQELERPGNQIPS